MRYKLYVHEMIKKLIANCTDYNFSKIGWRLSTRRLVMFGIGGVITAGYAGYDLLKRLVWWWVIFRLQYFFIVFIAKQPERWYVFTKILKIKT